MPVEDSNRRPRRTYTRDGTRVSAPATDPSRPAFGVPTGQNVRSNASKETDPGDEGAEIGERTRFPRHHHAVRGDPRDTGKTVELRAWGRGDVHIPPLIS